MSALRCAAWILLPIGRPDNYAGCKALAAKEIKMASRDGIVTLLDRTLRTRQIKDSSCNGLQVQGSAKVRRVALAVDACMEAYEKASAAGCQMLIVHHGLIWNGLRDITGRAHKHVRFLIEHEMSLYASHLPLDMHEEYGNNIGLARLLKLRSLRPFGEYHDIPIGYQGRLPRPAEPREIARRLSGSLGGKAVVLPHGPRIVRTVGVVSGGAGDILEQSAAASLDCYVTGELVHFCFHIARELAANAIFLGHYHSEKLGVQALGRLLAAKLGLECVFLELGTFAGI
jgi:dinuclear metal center YbgI/SA1388 family protein